MSTSSVSSGSTMAAIQVDVMKKAQEVAARDVLSVLDSASQQTQQTSSAIAGIGNNIDIKA
ncbi:hypothetical protein [Sulfurimonas sp.]|uniref:hypothetical protein n=1 Tax=Sulfurimonas sp. TaxID=2022749 RepID=UPI003D0D1220